MIGSLKFQTVLYIQCLLSLSSIGQVDTASVYNAATPYGVLDLRIANSSSWYYYLQEGKTFSFREASPGVPADTYLDMTAWNLDAYTEGNLREKHDDGDFFTMNYRLLLPREHDASYSAGYPLLLVLHGAAESGNCWNGSCYHADKNYSPRNNIPEAPTDNNHRLLNNDNNLLHGGKEHLDARNEAGNKLPDDPTLSPRAFPGFILFPQSLNGWDESAVEDAIRIVRLLTKKYNIDQNRIYIHGYSNGGHGVYEAIKRAPWLFAAAMTMSAIDDASITKYNLESKLAHIPLWIFQGARDGDPAPKETEAYIEKFKKAGGKIRYTKYDNLGHGTWNAAYDEPDFFSWMLGNNKANIHPFGGNASLCETTGDGLLLELPAGFISYEWEYNGAVLPDAKENTLLATNPGTYRARFSRISIAQQEVWNRWSDPLEISVKNTTAPLTGQEGTILLKDLNGNNDAKLYGPKGFVYYYWYKDGKPLKFPGNAIDTVRSPTITSARGKGSYTLSVADYDNCKSPASEPKYIFFNDEAPVNITAPVEFKADALSSTAVRLSWSDVSTDENGFEIWRRSKSDGSTYSAWHMSVLTEANAVEYSDHALPPSTTLQYKIRAVSNSGRSDYTPSGENEFLEITTPADLERPSPPANLEAQLTAVQQMTLTWNSAKDNSTIKEYYIYMGPDSITTGSADTVFVLSDLQANTLYNFTVKAMDESGNLSVPSNTVSKSTHMSGLYYEHSTGAWSNLEAIDWSQAEYTGFIDNFSLSPKTQEDYFNFRFDGYLYIEQDGLYQFRTSSNDGSTITLNDSMIVNNDGIHEVTSVESNEALLFKGPQRIQVDFFDYRGGDTLAVQYKGADTGNEWITIPSSALKSDHKIITGTENNPVVREALKVNVFPNPVISDGFNLLVRTNLRDPVQVKLINPLGEVIATHEYQPEQIDEGVYIKTSSAAGIYILLLTQGETSASQRIMVHR